MKQKEKRKKKRKKKEKRRAENEIYMNNNLRLSPSAKCFPLTKWNLKINT